MPDDAKGGKVPENKAIDHEKSKVRKDADGNITAVRLVFTDGTSVIVTKDDIASSDQTFDFGTTAQNENLAKKAFEKVSDEWNQYAMSEEGQDALSVEDFKWKNPITHETQPLNMQDIRTAVDKRRLGKALEPWEVAMLASYEKQALAINDAKERKVRQHYTDTQIMMKVSKLRKQVGEIFKFTSDEQERMCSATWFCGDGATILSGIPGVGKSQYILVAMMLFCNGLNRNEINQARRQNHRFTTLIQHYKDIIEQREKQLKNPVNLTEEDINKLKNELRAFNSTLKTLKGRHDSFLIEVRRKMERHTAIVRLDPEKTPEEIFYWTRVGLKEVDPTATLREQAYSFTPMPRDIVLKPIKFFNEANRMNPATQDAVLGLMAEHEIEYLGRLFPSPNSEDTFCNKEARESWMWTEDIIGSEVMPEKVMWDENVVVRCPHHKVSNFTKYPVKKNVNGVEVWETEQRDVEDVTKETPDVRLKLLTNPEFLDKLPEMEFTEGEWQCTSPETPKEEVKDEMTGVTKMMPIHRSKAGSIEDKTFLDKPPLSYVLTPDIGQPWMTTYTDKVKGQIVWFDTNPHVKNRLDLATIDRLDASVIFPALKLGGKSDLLRLKFPHKAEPVGESLVKIAFRRILTLPTELETEPSIDPLTYDELLHAWTLVRENVDPSSMISAITLISEVFSVSATRLRATDNVGNAEIYGTQRGRDYPVHNPVVRGTAASGSQGTQMLGEAAQRTNWGAFTDMSIFEEPGRAVVAQTVVRAGDQVEESGVKKDAWPTWELLRTFGTRSAESITKLAKSIAFLEACDRIRADEKWPGESLEMNHVMTVVPYVYSHRIWVESSDGRGIDQKGKMFQIYPNVESFIRQEILNNWLLANVPQAGMTVKRVENYIELFDSAMSWCGRMGVPPNWIIPPSPTQIMEMSPSEDLDTLADPLRNAIWDLAVYRFKEESRPLLEYYQNKIKILRATNYTRAQVMDLVNAIEANTTYLTNLAMEPGTGVMTGRRPNQPTTIGGDRGVLVSEINETMWNNVLAFEASSSSPRIIIPFLLYMYDPETTVTDSRGRPVHPSLPGMTADQKKKIESAIKGVDASGTPIGTNQDPLFTFTYNYSGDKITIVVSTETMKSMNPNKMVGGAYPPVPTQIKVTLESENRDQAMNHRDMWEAIEAVVRDPDGLTRSGKEKADYIVSRNVHGQGADFVRRIKELIP